MPIKIFLKHLFTSIKKRPAQPILLIIVIALSVALSTVALNIRLYLDDEYSFSSEAQYGNADFAVSLSSISDTRFLFESDVKEALSLDDVTCGEYTLPIYYENKFAYGLASDYVSFSKMFPMSMDREMELRESDVKGSIYISKTFANENNLNVGDKITLSILNIEKEFTIYGITKIPIQGQYVILMDITSAIDVLASSSMFIALIEDDFIPSSKVYVDCAGDSESAIADITNHIPSAVFARNTKDINVYNGMDMVVGLIVAITVFFSFAVIYCCFAVLTAQRKKENALFYAIGAKGYMLNLMSIIELLIYWFVGSVIGVLLSMPLSNVYIKVAEMDYVSMFLEPWVVAVAVVVSLIASLLSLLFFMLIQNKAKKKVKKQVNNAGKKEIILVIVLIALTFIFSSLSTLPIMEPKVYFGILGFFFGLVASIYTSKLLFNKISIKLSFSKKLSIPTLYALKNSHRVESNANATGVLTIFFIVVIVLIILTEFAVGSLYYFQNKLELEYVVSNASEESYEKISEIEGVDVAYHFLYERNLIYEYNGKQFTINLVSADDIRAFNERLHIPRLPEGNEVYIPEHVCMTFHLEVGDEVTIHYAERDMTLKIIGYHDENLYTFIINAEDMGLEPAYIGVQIKDGYEIAAVEEEIANTILIDNAVLVSRDSFFSFFRHVSLTYIVCVYFVTIFLVIFALIGIIDSIVASYISRQEEFNNYKLAGMCKKDVRKLIASELIYVILIAFLALVLFFGFEFLTVFEMLFAYHCNLFFVL